jgi:hypothetical protein
MEPILAPEIGFPPRDTGKVYLSRKIRFSSNPAPLLIDCISNDVWVYALSVLLEQLPALPEAAVLTAVLVLSPIDYVNGQFLCSPHPLPFANQDGLSVALSVLLFVLLPTGLRWQ